ncbi:UNVERIFIED_ORG: hypothetical protein QQG_5799 [Clostridioides difficile Y384]
MGRVHQVERGGGREEGRPSQEKAGDQPSGDPFLGLQKGIRQAAEDDGRGSRQGCHPDAGPALRQHRPDHCRGRPRR